MRYCLRTLVVTSFLIPPFLWLGWKGWLVPANEASQFAAVLSVAIIFILVGMFVAPKPPCDHP
jgi:hypothetical protein